MTNKRIAGHNSFHTLFVSKTIWEVYCEIPSTWRVTKEFINELKYFDDKFDTLSRNAKKYNLREVERRVDTDDSYLTCSIRFFVKDEYDVTKFKQDYFYDNFDY